jgi:GTPase KRas protein
MEPSDTTTVSNHAIHVIDGRSVFVHVVDTPLHEDHYLVRELFLKPAHCFMLVYDVASRTSFEKIVEYRNQLLAAKGLTPEASAAHQVPIVLVGNDAHGFGARQISTDEGEDLAALLRCPYIETSSATGDHVEKAFRRIMDAVRDPGGPVKDGYQS